MNIKNSLLYYIRYKQVNWYDYVRKMNEERLPQTFWNGDRLEEEEEEEEEERKLEICGCRK